MTTGKAGGSKVGKFGIGVHVVDDVGDVGVIVGKRKGERQVDYDRYGKIWVPKFRLAVAANDNATPEPSISPEIVVNDYSGADDGENSSEWVPKVGDRVRYSGKSPAYSDKFMVGTLGTVREVIASNSIDVEWDVEEIDGAYTGGAKYLANIEPLPVAEQPAADDRPDAGGGFKAGDRIRLISGELPLMPIGSEFVAIARTRGAEMSVHFMDGDGDETWRPGAYFELVTPLTIEAGKSYRTRDGRKVGPILKREYASGSPYQWVGEASNGYRLIFKDDGENYEGRGSIHDLVAEWVEPAAEDDLEVAEAEVKALLAEPTSPAKFKVGDRVVIIGNEGDPAVVKTRNSEGKMSIQFDWAGRSGIEWWCDDELAPLPPAPAASPSTFARNDLVTLAAPVKVTGTSGDRVHISFPSGGSFTLPVSALIAA